MHRPYFTTGILLSSLYLIEISISQIQSKRPLLNSSWKKRAVFNPEENPRDAAVASRDLFEGDIVMSEDEEEELLEDGVAGAGLIWGHFRWPHQTVPYVIGTEFSKLDEKIVLEAMGEISSKTCVRFKPREDETDYVYVQNGTECSSRIGMTGGRQDLTLSIDLGCIQHGVIMHELVHAIGFWHEQSRTDRDLYVEIQRENVQEEYLENFETYTSRSVNEFGVPYDYDSIMHYRDDAFISQHAFAKGLKTIVALKDGVKMGQRRYLSQLDALKINRMNCLEREVTNATISAGGHLCVSECRKTSKSYTWCYLDNEEIGGKDLWFWDYCTPDDNHPGQHNYLKAVAADGIISSHGIPCGSKCNNGEDVDYFWCTTLKPWRLLTTWDYCSPIAGHDYKMNKCSSPCDYNGKSYKWCYLAKGGWGYCSSMATKQYQNLKDGKSLGAEEVIASHGNVCATECGKKEGTKYNWCKTSIKYKGHDWDYCSATAGHDYKGRVCSSKCGYQGYKYKWCKVVGGGWGYCSH